MMSKQVRTRFAPSPTGFLHLGGLRSALYTWLFARKEKGVFMLRIEDTDQQRLVEGATEAIYRSLRLAGLDWDEGPDVGGDYGPYIQSQRRDMYAPYAWELVEKGEAYVCFCTKERLDAARAEAEARGETYKYDKHCLSLSKEEVKARIAAGESYVIRQNVTTEGTSSCDDVLFGHIEVENSTLDDTVLLKADGLPTYNFANVVDDHTMGITHVLRGSEYLSSTPKYNLLYKAFGWDIPVYVHMPPVMATPTRKLSKRYGDPTFEDLLSKGYLADAVVNYIALLGWNPGDEREMFTLPELVEAFSLEHINKAPAVFDMQKLTWFNAEYIRAMPAERFHELIRPYFAQVIDVEKMDTLRLAQLMQTRCEVLPDVVDKIDFLAQLPDYDIALYTNKRQKTNPENSFAMLTALLPLVENIDPWTEEAISSKISGYIQSQGLKNGPVLWPLRIAVSGKESTPGGFYEIAYLLGRDETLRRLRLSMEKLHSALAK